MEHEKADSSTFLEFLTSAHEEVESTIAKSMPKDGRQPKDNEATTATQNEQLDVDPFRWSSVQLPSNVQAATHAEHKMSFLRGVRLYPKAIAWSALLSATIIMEGYDTTLIGNFFAFPVFRRNYGHPVPGSGYQISPSWQTALPNGAITGEILGLCLNGILTDRFGYKRTVIVALVWLCVFVLLAFFGFHIEMLMASTILCGLSWGIFQTLSTTYAGDVMPVALRAYLTSNVNNCWLIGQLISAGVIRGLVHENSEWSYRIPFGLQWVFAVIILAGVVFAPESPYWLIRHGRTAEAKQALQRLTSGGVSDINVDDAVALMIHTDDMERAKGTGTSYLDCFKGTDLRRTEIAVVVWVSQALCGGPLIGYATYFYEQANIDTEGAFGLTTGMFGLAIVGNIIAWTLMRVVGRRTLYLWGLSVCIVIMLVIGIVSCIPPSIACSWALGSLVVTLTFCFNCTIGPVCYALVAEVPSTRLRVKTVVVARIAYNLTCLITNVLAARMLNPTAWNWKGKTAFVFAGATVLCLVWCYYRLPEPQGLTYLELDLLFDKKAEAKKFKAFQRRLEETGYFSAPSEQPVSEWRGSIA